MTEQTEPMSLTFKKATEHFLDLPPKNWMVNSSSVEPLLYTFPSNSSGNHNNSIASTVDFSRLVFYDRTQAIPILIYVILLFIIGVPGNAFVCYIYYFKWTKKTSRVFIIALAVFDLINNIASLPVEAALMLNFYNFDIPWLCKSSRFLTFAMNSASSTVLIGIAVDRLKGICYWSRMRPMSVQTAKTIVAFAVFLGLVTSWPSILIYGTYTVGGTLKTCLYDDHFKGSVYSSIFAWYVLSSNIVYDALLIIIYSIIGKHIIMQRYSKGLQNGSTKKNKYVSSRKNSLQSTSGAHEEDIFLYDRKSNQSTFSGPLTRYTWLTPPKRNLSGSMSDLPNNKIKSGILVRSASCGSRTWVSAIDRSYSSASEGFVVNRRYSVGKTTTMLFLVTVVFILSFVPYCVISIFRLGGILNSFLRKANIAETIIFHLFLRSYLLSSCFNPLIYNGLNRRFRKECKDIVKKLFCFVCKRCRTMKKKPVLFAK